MTLALVAFDLDDTLYPERAFVRSGFRATAAFLTDRGLAARSLAPDFETAFEEGVRGDVFNRVLAAAGIEPTDALIRDLVRVYRTHRWPGGGAPAELSLYPDAERALVDLERRGVATGLVSDGPLEGQRTKVDALGLADRLDGVILTDAWGRAFWKPHPRAFREMPDRLDVDPAACLYVADNPEKDFQGPAEAGWLPSVRLKRPEGLYSDQPMPADAPVAATISTLDDLADVLRKVDSAP